MAVCTLESSCLFFTNHGVIIDHGPTTRVAARGHAGNLSANFSMDFVNTVCGFLVSAAL
jgi:hypothetical protein